MMNTEEVRRETIKVLLENLDRCGGECQVTVRNVVKIVQKRLDLKKSNSLIWLVNKALSEHPWTTLWGRGHRKGHSKTSFTSLIYQAKARTAAEYAAAANLEVAV